MRSHHNDLLIQKSRLRLVTQHMEHRGSIAELYTHSGTSLRSAYRCIARYRSGGPASLADRRSVRRSQGRTLDPQRLELTQGLRHHRLHLWPIALLLRVLSRPSPELLDCRSWT